MGLRMNGLERLAPVARNECRVGIGRSPRMSEC